MTEPERTLGSLEEATRPERRSVVGSGFFGAARRWFVRVVVGGYCVSSVLTLIWTIYTSVKSDRDLFGRGPWALPATVHFENYVDVWARSKIGNYFFNSFYLSALSTVVAVVVSAMAAYVISRIVFRGSRITLYYFIAAMMVPTFLFVVPLYFMMVRNLHLYNSHLGLIMLYVSGSLPFDIFILTGFFKTLPTELDEAATIDGASANVVFWRIMLPLAKTGLVTIAIFNFIGNWNEFFWSLILLEDKNLFTISRGLYALFLESQYQAKWTELFAGLLIATVPVIVVFAFLQDQITAGLTMGALKG
jgi:N-acetylglucosamine transport system permease protein